MALIKYDRNTALGSMVSSVVNGAIQMKFLSTRLKDVMDSAIVAGDYGPVETLFGLDVGAGTKTLSAALTRVRVTTVGVTAFTAGSINVLWE